MIRPSGLPLVSLPPLHHIISAVRKVQPIKTNEMEHFKTMEAEGIAAIVSAVVGLAGGKFWGKSQQLDEVKLLISEYQEAHKLTKEDLSDIRAELERSKKAEEICFQQHREAMHRIDELDRGIRSFTGIPTNPKKE